MKRNKKMLYAGVGFIYVLLEFMTLSRTGELDKAWDANIKEYKMNFESKAEKDAFKIICNFIVFLIAWAIWPFAVVYEAIGRYGNHMKRLGRDERKEVVNYSQYVNKR